MKRGATINKFLKPLDEAPVQAYFTDELQVPDVLEWILDQLGKSRVFQTTFSISEEYLRRLYFIRKKGLISSLDILLDFKATNKTVDLWVFISEVVDKAYLADNHSKIILVTSESGRRVVVITSQNLTRGNRAESAVIIEDNAIADTIESQINKTLKFSAIKINDLLEGTA